jgi:polyphosphate kinase
MTVEQRQANFRVLNPVTATTREIAEVLNRTINGGLNSIGYVTLSGTTTETTVLDDRYNVETLVFLTPVGHDPWHHNPYVKDTSTNGNIVIGHANAGHDATFAYLLIG